ncbi:50S ribosomal protein L13 [Cerasicoccus fimbriatus]|uniref:50S ribosomal protein L13 n=1 Tax=Cerasicoccus fimbriatus TaxID=3014554 RepID=UPI0022B49D6E|nr:50S ribosomal protein L13 [Cerasicoccus sp. TK19100]
MKTTLAKPDADKKWVLVDAEGKVLGRIAVEIANILRGRNKPTYTPHVDAGDYVVVINAEKVKLTGRKEEDKQYMFHTGWVGNEYRRNVAHFRANKPAFLIENAVKGMLPRNKLARHMMSKLKVYAGSEHPHEAQNPQPLSK